MARGCPASLLVLAVACGQRAADGSWFEERARATGLDFVHVSGHQERRLFPEIMSGGVGLIDYDRDGALDVYLVQGGTLAAPGPRAPRNRLFRNRGDGTFADVTAAAGVGDAGYGMGCSCADYDGDGDTDLYVTNVGPNVLYRNEGDGTFTDVTVDSGVGEAAWSTSAVFADYDADGDLDLYVANYVRWSADDEGNCLSPGGLPDYCNPKNYEPAADTLYRNDGDGTFTDVSDETGIGSVPGNGLGVVAGDFDSDGRQDFYVANDLMANTLWIATGEGRFEDRALVSGCALSGLGGAEAGMGVLAEDVEGDGDLDLFATHLREQKNTLYLNAGGLFQDSSARAGLAVPSIPYTGFGVGLADFDNDGDLDAFVANGRVMINGPFPDPRDKYAEENLLFEHVRPGRFREVTPRGGVQRPLVATSRGAAFGDLDGDGGVDVVVVNRDERVHLLRNRVRARGNWVSFRVLGDSGSDAIGSVVRIEFPAGVRSARVNPGYGYCSSNDPRAHFGIGEADAVEAVTVRWPDGTEEAFGPHPGGVVHELRRGEGRP